MSKLFMYGTSLEEIEQLMMMVPNFQPRRSGIVINNYFNCKEDVKDCNCNMVDVSNRCNYCEYIHFDILSNVNKMGYKDLAKECFGKIRSHYLKDRLKLLTYNFKGEIFLNHNHKERFYSALNEHDIYIDDISPRYIAVVFLITSDQILWNLTEHTVRPNEFDFSKTHLREICTEGYALYKWQKLYGQEKNI